ncbi:TetR/AcrR family transcriptional regulator [Spongiactinospora sp. 9N601]|uniref:TetR/AcrR family transcriptional regulator n=1 Tax=Spongiactinospora sp. 9N601 TaxID=3375149 RepID=UPI00379C01A1
MSTRRERAADAAIEVIAEEGMRGLTHRAVDARAGLPPGSTSSCYRTRLALLGGVLARMLEQDEASLERLPQGAWHSPEEVADALAGLLGYWLGPARTRTQARMELYLDAARRALLWEELDVAGARFLRKAEEGLRAAGVPDPVPAARMFVAQIDGVLFDALARPDGVDGAWLRYTAETIVRSLPRP